MEREVEGEERFGDFTILFLLSLWEVFHLMEVNIIPLILLTSNEIRTEHCNHIMPHEAQLTCSFLFCLQTKGTFHS